ncbi:MAG: hypothetical protein WAK66_15810 [Methylocystis sp.]
MHAVAGDGFAQFDREVAKLHTALVDQSVLDILRNSYHAVLDDDAFGAAAASAKEHEARQTKKWRGRQERSIQLQAKKGERALDND